jgi:hypothetical protein
VPSKICMILDYRAVSAGQRRAGPRGISTDSARVVRRLAAAPGGARVVEDGPCAVHGGGHEVAVDAVRDLDALVTEPAGAACPTAGGQLADGAAPGSHGAAPAAPLPWTGQTEPAPRAGRTGTSPSGTRATAAPRDDPSHTHDPAANPSSRSEAEFPSGAPSSARNHGQAAEHASGRKHVRKQLVKASGRKRRTRHSTGGLRLRAAWPRFGPVTNGSGSSGAVSQWRRQRHHP